MSRLQHFSAGTGREYFHESPRSNRASIEKHGLRSSDEGIWLVSDRSRLSASPKMDHWKVDPPGEVSHGSEASIEWEPEDPVHVIYHHVPPHRLQRLEH